MPETQPPSPSKLRTWIASASVLALIIILYPPQAGRYDGRSWSFLFSASPTGRIDYGRLSLEVAAALLVALFLAFLPFSSKLHRLRVPRKVGIGLLVAIVCLLMLWGASVAARISRSLPPQELARLGGEGTAASGTFSGTLYNGSSDWTVREVTIRIVQKQQTDPNDREYYEPDEKEYRIDGLWIVPLQTRSLQVDVLSPRGLQFDSWRIVAARGFKNYW